MHVVHCVLLLCGKHGVVLAGMHVVHCVLLLCGRHGVVLAGVHVVEAWCCPSWCACGRGMVLSKLVCMW